MTDDLTKNAVAVVECETLFEGIRFPSGDLMTIELTRPRKAFAVVRRIGEEIHVMSLHDDRSSAVRRADETVSLIKEEEVGQAPGGQLQ